MAQEPLHRTLKLPQLVFYGVGSMVGAGIYSVIGAATGIAGSFLWLSFVFAGIAAFLTVLSYAELASMFPKTGAEYNFLKEAFPTRRIFSFMAGYLIALNAVATSATVSLAFGGYLNTFVSLPVIATALALLIACTAINILGIRQSTWIGIFLITIEVAGLVLLVWTGFVSGDPGKSFEAVPSSGALGIFAATALIFFIYIGFEDVANLAEESQQPTRTVPRALLLSVIFTTVLYVLVAFAFIALVDVETAGQSESPLSDAAGAIAPWRGHALAIAALFATASTALISLVSISRMLFGMARGGDMPNALAKTLPGRKTPWVAALVLFGGACLLLPLGEVRIVASVSSFGVLLVFAGVQAAMIVLRFRQPQRPRPFRVPGTIGRWPVFPSIGIAIVLALLTRFEPIVYAVGGGAAAAGLVVYFVLGHTGGARRES